LVGGAQSRLGSAQCQFFNGKDFGGPGAQAQGVGTQADCCSACVGNAQCKASVWVKTPTFTGCYLKYSIKQPITCSNGCVACIPGAGPPPPPPHSDGSFALKADLTGPKFFDGFDFFTAKDPTLGFVTYLNKTAAFAAGLAGVNSAGHVFMRADHTAGGTLPRRSVRVTSKQVFDPKMLSADTAGAILVVVDIAHMPTGCGVWPAFWMESSSAHFRRLRAVRGPQNELLGHTGAGVRDVPLPGGERTGDRLLRSRGWSALQPGLWDLATGERVSVRPALQLGWWRSVRLPLGSLPGWCGPAGAARREDGNLVFRPPAHPSEPGHAPRRAGTRAVRL
jgi:hypothetical protein